MKSLNTPVRNSWVTNWQASADTAAQELRAFKKQVNDDADIRLRMLTRARSLTPEQAGPTMERLIRAPLAGLR